MCNYFHEKSLFHKVSWKYFEINLKVARNPSNIYQSLPIWYHLWNSKGTYSMGVFHVFYIAQMVPNCEKCKCDSKKF